MHILKKIWEGWKRIAHRIARFNSMVICTVLYFLLLPFVAIPFRLGRDPLNLSGRKGFSKRSIIEPSLEDSTRQG